MDTKTIRSLAVLSGYLIVSTWAMPAAAIPGDFSLNLCAGSDCTQLVASADGATGQLDVTFADTSIGSGLFSGLTFSGSIDPSLVGSFTLKNLSGSTQLFTVSATLGVLPIGAPTSISGSYGPVVLIDGSDNGAELIASPFYAAQIDGGTVMTLGNLDVKISSGSTTTPPEFFSNQPGPGVASSFGVAFSGFSLTAGDSVQVPFAFTVGPAQVPEPASLALLALAFAGMGFARKRKLN